MGRIKNWFSEQRQELLRKREFYDFTLIFVVLLLCTFGLIMMYSITGYSDSVKYNGNSLVSTMSQAKYMVLSIAVMLFVSMVDYRKWLKFAIPAFLIAFAMLVAVQFVGKESHGEKRWLILFGISVQPTELMKIALVMFFPVMINFMYLNLRGSLKRLDTYKAWIYVFIVSVLAVMPVLISNLSSAIIIAGMIFIMLFAQSKRPLVYPALLIALVLFLVLAYRTGFLEEHILEEYQMDRINAWLDPNSDPLGDGYQILQSLYAVGSGGFFGRGLGQSIQKLGKLPEAQNDMIFAIICEELGLFGTLIVIGLFAILIWRMALIAFNAPDLRGTLLVIGVIAHVSIQVIFNIMVAFNLMPNTGVSLPFISAGGTALLCMMVEIGLVLSVSGQISRKRN